MSAVPAIKTNDDPFGILKSPYNSWQAEEVLAYFQSRNQVHYFAIADESEVSRDKIDGILINRFDFNGDQHCFENQIDWLNNPSSDIEWVIMLHKFYYAVGLGMAYQDTGDVRYVNKWIQLTRAWIEQVPVDHLSADVTGRRVQNWIFAHYYFVTTCQADAVTPEFYQLFLNSIHAQVTYLCSHLTPTRNHRTLELYTIFLAAVVFPELQDADEWLRFSSEELLVNLLSDILPDGVHCELSTDYHHIVLRNFLAVKRLAVLNKITLADEFDERIKQALEFSIHAHKPDGLIPSLSDGDTGSFLNLLQQGYELYGDKAFLYIASFGEQGVPPAQRTKAFPDGGYYILRSGWGELGEPYQDERYLIFDCGPVGAGNHGHLDLLSFEMAAYGQSLIVDPGRYTYDESGEFNWRVLFRSTRYHNTVVVDGLDQCRYQFHKTKFKITGQHPEFELKSFVSITGFDYLHGVARSFEYPVVHERKIVFVNGEYWLICDLLMANEPHHYDLPFHLSTLAQGQVKVSKNLNGVTVSSPHLLICQPHDARIQLSVEPGFVSQTYGIKQAAPIVSFNCEERSCCFYTVVHPFKENEPTVSVSFASVSTHAGGCNSTTAAALEIVIGTAKGSTTDRLFIAHQPGEYLAWNRSFNVALHVERLMENYRAFSSQVDHSPSSVSH